MSLKNIIGLLILAVILLTGCAENDTTNWDLSPTFTYDNLTLYGTEGKFGMIKVNGENGEPEFPVNKGRQYNVYFFENTEDFNGKRYKMDATHKDTDETAELYEWEIENKQSGMVKQHIYSMNLIFIFLTKCIKKITDTISISHILPNFNITGNSSNHFFANFLLPLSLG